MPPASPKAIALSRDHVRRIWMRAQRLDERTPFGSGPQATKAAIEHLGYVQIDTINVIERCHHHILQTRIPDYERGDLHHAQSIDRSVFEYWTHALSFVPTRDIRFFLGAMKQHRDEPKHWNTQAGNDDRKNVIARIRKNGPLTIRDIDDDVLVEKDHAWASRKPSKRALQHAFYNGELTISARAGMLKTYELFDRHFGWDRRPTPASQRQVLAYLLDRALRAQGIVSLDSICHLDAPRKAGIAELIAARVKSRTLVPVAIEGADKTQHWTTRETLDEADGPDTGLVHILSPFDPLIIQRRRLRLFFGYDHRFEAYVPREKRLFGYFALPVLAGDTIVAVLDLKTDRAAGRLLIQQWSWIEGHDSPELKESIEDALARFERFQLATATTAPRREAGTSET